MTAFADKPAFVLIHGAWHSHETWTELTPELEARGHAVVSIDLPGAGANAATPASFHERPLNPEAFGTEPSPNAAVSQAERTEAAVAAVREAAGKGNGQVVLVGHSLGGLTISPVAEQIPDELAAVVYLTAFLLPNGTPAGALIGHEIMARAQVPPLFMADPEVVGALRMDTASTDPDYVAKCRSAFYGDLTDEQFATALSRLHCDEPAAAAGEPSNVTAERFGTVDRHYIRCTEDLAIVIEGQDHMIDITDASLGSKTTIHTMNTSHSPFYSDPAGLAEILGSIAS